MKKQINPTIKAHLIRGAFYLLLLLAVCAVPFALAQSRSRGTPVHVAYNVSAVADSVETFSQPQLGSIPAARPQDSKDASGADDANALENLPAVGCEPGPWTLAANYPFVLESPAVTSNGTFAYSAGGRAANTTNAFFRYDPVANTWTSLANMPTAEYAAGVAYAANVNKLYLFGGLDASNNLLNTTQIYNISTNTWSTGAAMPAARFFPAALYYGANGKIYVIGGFVDAVGTVGNQTWEYDPVANTWNTSRANMPGGLGGSGHSIVGQFIFIQGGLTGGVVVNTHYRYDIVANTWATKAPVPVPMYRPASAAVGPTTYLAGGGNPSISQLASRQARLAALLRAPATSYSSTYIYDTTTNNWTTGPNLHQLHSFTGGTAIGNRLLVVAGFNAVTDINAVEMSVIAQPCGTPTPTPPLTGPPVVTTNPATFIGSFSTTLDGSLNPHGLSTTVHFQYGRTTAYGLTTAPRTQTGNTVRNVAANIGNLTANTTYHFRIVASNVDGTRMGADRTFTTLTMTGAPVVITNPATLIASFSATLNGLVDPHGLPTSVHFQYGTTTSYGFTTPTQSRTGNTYLNISANISGLSASHVYHFRIVAVNSAGTRYGGDRTFTTP